MLASHAGSYKAYADGQFSVHALIRVSVLGVALPTSSAFISVEVTNLHGEAWCCLSLHVRLAWGGTESVDVLVFRFVFPLFPALEHPETGVWPFTGYRSGVRGGTNG